MNASCCPLMIALPTSGTSLKKGSTLNSWPSLKPCWRWGTATSVCVGARRKAGTTPKTVHLSMASTKPDVKFRRTQYPPHKNQHAPEKSDITSPMENSHPNVYAISDLATGNGNDVTPFSQQSVVLTKQAYIELTWKANYWQAQHARSVERAAALTAKVAALEATVRDLTQRLYGTKSEKSARPDEVAESQPLRLRQRGQQ